MGNSFEGIRQSLCVMAESYHAVAEGGRLKPNEWLENVRLLKPIAEELITVADIQISKCQKELEEKKTLHAKCLEERVKQYALVETKRSALTKLDESVIGLTTEIDSINSAINGKQLEIQNYQKELCSEKAKKKKWNTVFWATCWIPFVNIGTGCKKGDVDAEYRAKVKQLDEEIKKLQNRSSSLNDQLKSTRQQVTNKNAESAEITRQITAANGRVAELTTELNDLSSQICLWQSIRAGCAELRVKLDHPNGNLAAVQECFEDLLKVHELLKLPPPGYFMDNRMCRGPSLRAGESLQQSEYLMSSNRKYIAVLGTDNALTVYNTEQALWSSGTQGAKGEGILCLDGHGPVALVGTDCTWNTKRPGAVSLVMQDDGNLVVYDDKGQSLWASDTFTYANVPSGYF